MKTVPEFKVGDKVYIGRLYGKSGSSYRRESSAEIVKKEGTLIYLKYTVNFWQQNIESVHLGYVDIRLLTPLELALL